MCDRSVFVYFLIAVCGSAHVHAQFCKLNARQIADPQRIYLTRSGSHWTLLQHEFVQSLLLVCNPTNVVQSDCQTDGSFSVPLPYGRCARPMRAALEPLVDVQCTQLGGQLYRVGYQLHNDFLTIYESCYNNNTVRTLYTKHEVYQSNLPAPTFTAPPFATDSIISGAAAASFRADKVYERFRTLLGERQTYIPSKKDQVIDRGHLAPAGAFIAFDQMRATYKMINVMPQFSGPNRSNWKRIENWIKTLPLGTDSVLVLTGNYDVLSLPHSQQQHRLVPMFLLDGARNPIPKWTFKVVKQGNICTVVVTYNNQFVNANNVPAKICPNMSCPGALKFNEDVNSGYSYCCDYELFAQLVGNYVRIC